jgi:hypothetical protein
MPDDAILQEYQQLHRNSVINQGGPQWVISVNKLVYEAGQSLLAVCYR